jgi:hypothetical protein
MASVAYVMMVSSYNITFVVSGSIIIHALEERAREYYDLESIWTKEVSPNISVQELETSLVKTRRRDHSQKPMKSI